MKNFLAVLFLSIPFAILAQTTTFQRQFDANSQTLRAISKTKDSNYISVSSRRVLSAVKFDQQGDSIWTKTYTPQRLGMQVYSVDPHYDSGFIIAGSKRNASTSNVEALIFKIDSVGNTVWANTLRLSSSGNRVIGTFVGKDSTILVCGNYGAWGSYKGFLAKISPSGSLLWTRVSASGSNVDFLDVESDANGDIFVVGKDESGGDIVLKFNNSGSLLWSKRSNLGQHAEGATIEILPSGNLIIAGTPRLAYFGSYDFFIHKMDNSGNLIFSKTYGTSDADRLFEMAVEGDKIYVFGWVRANSDYNSLLSVLDTSGTMKFSRSYGTQSENQICYEGIVGYDNSILIASKKDGSGSYSYLIKTDSAGNVGCFNDTVKLNDSTLTNTVYSNGITIAANTPTYSSFTWSSSSLNYRDSVFCSGVVCGSISGTDVQTVCDSLTWINGITYTSSDSTATDTLTTAEGCDSVVTLKLTIINSNTGSDTVTSCDSYTWATNGQTYTTSGSYKDTLTNAAGCDSVVTLNLTINSSSTGTDVQTACDRFTWIDGNTYTTSNSTATDTLTNAAGCDSIVTLQLTILNSNTGSETFTSCDSYTWSTSGQTYSATGTYIETLTNAVGCDSMVTLNLTINNSSTFTDVQSACDAYTWVDGNTYTTSNSTATQTFTNAVGCDSVVSLDLTINTVNNSVSQNGAELTSDQASGQYQWVNCPDFTSISGATNATYNATTNGEYAVIVTGNGCTDTSDCYTVEGVGIIENSFGNSLQVFPNPTGGHFSVNLGQSYDELSVSIKDINGKVVHTEKFANRQVLDLELNEPKGVYFLEIRTEEKKALLRLMKE